MKNWSLEYVEGDLVKTAPNYDLIVHGCNCQCVMGGGIAKQIKKAYPEAYLVDTMTKKGDKSKLGTISVYDGEDVKIINAYTQFDYKWDEDNPPVDYDAIRSCMKLIKERYSGKKIGLPKIGCGLAGGDWDKVEAIIEEELEGENVIIVEYNG